MIKIRKAEKNDINAVAMIYSKIHTAEENGDLQIGWVRGVYPERITAESALEREDLFVIEDDNSIVGAAILNQVQVDVYYGAAWKNDVPDNLVFVMHTLVIDPDEFGKGYGSAMVRYYEQYALDNGCPYLRMDTNEKNLAARTLYNKLGYNEIGIVPCKFNGIEGVQLILLEKALK